MSNTYVPDPDGQVEKKSPRQLILLVLLLLIAVFAYLYFFTGIIKPREETAKPEPAPVMQVKRPLPPRPQPNAAVEAPTKEVAKAEAPAAATGAKEAKGAAPKAPEKGAPAAKNGEPAAKKAEAPVKKGEVSAKKGEAPAKGAPAGNAAQVAKAAPGKIAPGKATPGAPHPTQEAKVAKASPAPAQGAKAGKPGEGAKGGKEKLAKAPAAPAEKGNKAKSAEPAAESAAPAARAPYALQINDLAESEANAVVDKLKKSGIARVVKTKEKKGETMHRLYLADFADHAEAQEELQRLKEVAPSAFLLPERGRYAVYAGSYLHEKKAVSEQERLFDKGVKLLVKTATIQVPVLRLRAGGYPDKASATKAANSLKGAGIAAKVVKTQP